MPVGFVVLLVMSYLSRLRYLLASSAQKRFLEALAVVNCPSERCGSKLSAKLGKVGISYDLTSNIMEEDFSDTPIACKRGGPVSNAILLQGRLANAIIIDQAFKSCHAMEFLGFGDNGGRGCLGFSDGGKTVVIGTDNHGEVMVTSRDDLLFAPQAYRGFGATLKPDLAKTVEAKIGEYMQQSIIPDV